MALKLKIKNPRNPKKDIDSYIRLVGMEVNFDGYGELRFEVWHSEEARRDSEAKPYNQLFSVGVGPEEVIHGGNLMKLKYDDLIDDKDNLSRTKSYKEIKKHKLKWGNQLLDFNQSTDAQPGKPKKVK